MYTFRKAPPRFRRTVTVRTPSPVAPGAFDEESFDLVFEALSKEVSDALETDAKAIATPGDLRDYEIAAVTRIVVDWDDVVDETGARLPFDPAAFGSIAFYPWNREAIWTAYFEGLEEARLGNSGRRPGPGPQA